MPPKGLKAVEGRGPSMGPKVALVVTRGDTDETAAEMIAAHLGYRVVVPRNLSLHTMTRRLPDLILVDWRPGDVTENLKLVGDIRATAVLAEVPICVLYSSPGDVPDGLLTTPKLAAILMPCSLQNILAALERLGGIVPDTSPAHSTVTPPSPDSSPVWDLMHPLVRTEARSRFEAGHFADAAEAAMKAVNARVKTLWLAIGETEKDGKSLMLSAFSPTRPAIRLADLSTESGRNVQEGYMHMFAGAMQGIRNPKTHANVIITPERALHFLMIASLLMSKLDEAGAKAGG